MDIAQLIQTVAIYALPVLFAITVHEAAHGYAARYFGDNTAWKMGRVTLNPAKHIDPLGTIVMPLLLYFATSGAFLFGYAKPVPVRFGNLRNPKRDMIWVALAGPAANLVQALLWGILFYLLQGLGTEEVFFYAMCKAGISMNVGLFVFNLFPLPPMDGGRIMVGLLPLKQALAFSKLEPYGFFIVIALIYLRILDTLWMGPLSALTRMLLNVLLTPFAMLAS
ncbi:site-2 protease family protein [Rhodoferax sp. GW822-FHT02A01]|uniref:site-2 protease family protein n=1 Tax=Rhodoferax sp. GW822-FHT02A01 TaxID=3141537 RepID=UPI00315C6DDE